MGLKQWPASEQPREKLMKYGVKSLSNAELLALIIRTGTKEGTALALAEELLAMEQGLGSLGTMEPADYCRIRGIGTATACTLTAAVELGKRISAAPKKERVTVEDASTISQLFMEQMRTMEKEMFQVVHVNTKNEITSIENVSVGDLNSSSAAPREVFHNAIKRSSSGILLVHNHPSGDPEPSQADLLLTRRLVEAGQLLGVRVLDHIVIGDGIFVSFKERELM